MFPDLQKPFPDPEPWFETTLRYDLKIRVGEDLLISNDQSVFVVRPVQARGKDEWRLVLWTDLLEILASRASAVAEITWERIKVAYSSGVQVLSEDPLP